MNAHNSLAVFYSFRSLTTTLALIGPTLMIIVGIGML
jgi:hypothetical protein